MSYINTSLYIFSMVSLLCSIFVFLISSSKLFFRISKLKNIKKEKKNMIPESLIPNSIKLSLLEYKSNTIIASINEFPCVVGRSKTADVEIKNDVYISNLHALFTRQIESIYIEDLGSSNGTLINNARLVSKHMIENGDKMKIGNTEITLLINIIYDEDKPKNKYTKVLKHNGMTN